MVNRDTMQDEQKQAGALSPVSESTAMDERTCQMVKRDGFLTASQLDRIYAGPARGGFGISPRDWLEGERRSFEDLTGQKCNELGPRPVRVWGARGLSFYHWTEETTEADNHQWGR